jgi:hypothetical protein
MILDVEKNVISHEGGNRNWKKTRPSILGYRMFILGCFDAESHPAHRAEVEAKQGHGTGTDRSRTGGEHPLGEDD